MTRTTWTPNGSGSVFGPVISVTSAPRRAASSAIACPVLPLARLVMKRTKSMGSSVAPAYTSARTPSRSCARPTSASTASAMSSTGASRPSPS